MSTERLQAEATAAERSGATDALERARLAHLVEQGNLAVLLHVVAAPLLVITFYASASPLLLTGWTLALAAVLGARVTANRWAPRAQWPPVRLVGLLATLTVVTGAVWGATPWLFLAQGDATGRIVVLLLVVGIAAVAIPFIGCVWRAYAAFLTAVLAPAGVWLFTLSTPEESVLGALMVLYAAGLLLASQNYARNFQRSHELTAELARANANAERANQQLRERVQENLQAQAALARSEERFHTAFDHAPIGMALVTQSGRFFHANPTLAQLLGYGEGELDGQELTGFLLDEDQPGFETSVAPLRSGEARVAHAEVRFATRAGKTLWASMAVGLLEQAEAGEPQFIVEIQDITESIELSARLQYEAEHDPLTGLLNRRALLRRLEPMLSQSATTARQHTLAYVEVERFKIINDLEGHAAGDEVLRQVAGLLQQHMQPRDTLARLRGDEFAVLFEECDTATALMRAQAMVDTVTEFRFAWGDQVFRLDISVGLAPVDADLGGIDDVLRSADTACGAAKEGGGARVQIFQRDDTEMQRIQGRRSWVHRLTDALDQGDFELHAQPIMPIRDSDIERGLSFEILVRMRNRSGQDELFMPGQFIDAAERYGLATRLDQWVIDAVFDWFEQRPELVAKVEACAINLSGMSLDDPDFTRRLIDKMRSAPLAPPQLRFEITETAAIGHLAQARHFMERVESLGCRFALDDFGSGVSSFGYLRTLPVDTLKIDGQFVRDIADDAVDRALVRSIHEVGRVLGLETIAEFVQDEATLAILRDIGVDYAQGTHIDNPRPLASLFEHYPA